MENATLRWREIAVGLFAAVCFLSGMVAGNWTNGSATKADIAELRGTVEVVAESQLTLRNQQADTNEKVGAILAHYEHQKQLLRDYGISEDDRTNRLRRFDELMEKYRRSVDPDDGSGGDDGLGR